MVARFLFPLAFGIIAGAQLPQEGKGAFELFKEKFTKKYASPSEEKMRFSCWKQNRDESNRLNSLPGQKAKYGETSLSDLCPEEFEHYYLGSKHVIWPVAWKT